MKEKNKVKVVVILSLAATLIFVFLRRINNCSSNTLNDKVSSHKVLKTKKKPITKLINFNHKDNNFLHGDNQWEYPSEDKPYPIINNYNNINIVVSLSKQRVYIKDGNNTLYTMYCSSGINDSTPKGKFIICNRGNNFYNNELNEGANYWTSFTNNNVYLFHSVPTTSNGNYNVDEAKKLGKPASHGCIRLSVPDAKWINNNIPNGTQVIIK